jgi:excisionase family DNA binding protein
MAIQQQTILTTKDACERLQCGRELLYKLVQSGRLKAIDIGGKNHRYRFRPEDIEALFHQPPEQPPSVAVPLTDQNNKPVNAADREAVRKLRKRGFDV